MGGGTNRISGGTYYPGMFGLKDPDVEDKIMEELNIPIRDSNERFETTSELFKHLVRSDAEGLLARLKTENPKDPLSAKFHEVFTKNEVGELLNILEPEPQQKSAEPLDRQQAFEGLKKQAADNKGQQDLAAKMRQRSLSDQLDSASKTPPVKASSAAAVEKAPKQEDFVTDYPLMPSTENKLVTHEKETLKGSFPNFSIEHHTTGYRQANSSGLQQRLSELNGGAPLTDFEKEMVAGWDKEDAATTLTPIMPAGEKNVQAYQITKGGSGDRVTNYYDREGNKLAGPYHSEAALVNEGLGPLDYIAGGLAAKSIIGGLISRGRRLFATEAAEAVASSTGRSEGEAAASGAGRESAGASSWRQGSGTSIYAKPKGPAPKPPASEFTEAEEKTIRVLQDSGMTRKEAEQVIRETAGAENKVELVRPGSPNAGGTTRHPDWKNPGPGNKRP